MLAFYHGNGGEMSVESFKTMAVIDGDLAPVACAETSLVDVTVRSSTHGCAVRRCNIDAGVECAFTIERILALAEAGSHAAFNGPERGRIGILRPVAGEARCETA